MKTIEYFIGYTKTVDDEAWERVKEASIDNDILFYECIDIIKEAFNIDIPEDGELIAVYDDNGEDNVLLKM